VEYFFNFDKLTYLKGKRPDGCILCLVARGSEDVERLIVHDSGSFLVSLNLYPYNPGHLLIFPRRHVVDIRELDQDERRALDRIVDLSLGVLDSAFGPPGYNIGYNMGLAAGASIEHLHLHVIPRYQREIGIAELIAGKRVLVQDPRDTVRKLADLFAAASGRASSGS
jgi:ATP adenylyltransferase